MIFEQFLENLIKIRLFEVVCLVQKSQLATVWHCEVLATLVSAVGYRFEMDQPSIMCNKKYVSATKITFLQQKWILDI